MFSYPINRKILMLSKLLLIALLIISSMIVGYFCCGVFIVILDKNFGIIQGEFNISILYSWITTAIKAIITFCSLGMCTFIVGMIKKSVPMTIVSAVVFCNFRQFYIAGMDLHQENWPFVIGVVIVTILGVYYILNYKINQVE